ncbi:MAG: hypothetical protein JW994_07965 [Candidatus Omnitrophica bacterium]|nr:hypothetical protein [Candidatus Omnitrophota bacterium]
MKTFKLALVSLLFVFLAGCAGLEPPTPVEIIKRPLGTESVKLGMTMDEVRNVWGDPDQVNHVTDKEKWGGERTEWVYMSRTSVLPVDAGYLFKTKKLYFDGKNLTNIVEE